jgi:hypothetical protein
MRVIADFGRFWWDFVVGDEWRIAACVVTVLAGGALLVGLTGLGAAAITILTGVAIAVLVPASIALPLLFRRSTDR